MLRPNTVAKTLTGATTKIAAAGPSSPSSTRGQFTPKKVTVRFDVALTNKTSVALLEPTFPTPPAGADRAFPRAIAPSIFAPCRRSSSSSGP